MEADVFIGLGSNLGHPLERCREAAALLAAAQGVSFLGASSLYRTEPIGPARQDWFVNAVCRLATPLSPLDLLGLLQGIEGKMGKRVEYRWGPRVIDLDLLLYGDAVLDVPELQVPHPRMHRRRFVLQPLAEIAPGIRHPILKKSAAELLAGLDEGQKVELIESFEGGDACEAAFP